jgi:hypothetical protein
VAVPAPYLLLYLQLPLWLSHPFSSPLDPQETRTTLMNSHLLLLLFI